METVKASYIKINGKYIKPYSAWRKIGSTGYVMTRDKSGNPILEHRLLMEEIIGRKLLPGEQVHHYDGNKANNKKNNLIFCKNNSSHATMHEFQNNNFISKTFLTKIPCMLFTELKTGFIYVRGLYEGYHQELRNNKKIVYIKNAF